MKNICYINCKVASMLPGGEPYGLCSDAALVVLDGKVAWTGQRSALPERFAGLPVEDLGGRLVTPALIDCHTHLVFGGNRAREFELRLLGAGYEDIARQGGGIASTVRATREATDEELLRTALIRLDALIADGVGVVEVKSGYGLTIKDELRMLRIARRLEKERPVKVVTTWLAAHAVPAEYEGRSDDYINEVVIPGLYQANAEGLVDAVDGFCERIGFSTYQVRRVLTVARDLGLGVKLHAEQLSDQKGALLAASFGALSADHLEYLREEDVEEFAESGTVAVLLPGAFYALREKQLPPISVLRDHAVDMAIATDFNPGTSPLGSLLMAMNMACILFAMTPEEALSGVTRNAAKALGLTGQFGVLAPGANAEIAVWDVDHPSELSYWMGGSPLYTLISNR